MNIENAPQEKFSYEQAIKYIKELESKCIALRSSNTQLSHELAMLQALYCKKDIAFESYKKEVIAEFIRNEDHQ